MKTTARPKSSLLIPFHIYLLSMKRYSPGVQPPHPPPSLETTFPKSLDTGVKACTHTLCLSCDYFGWGSAISNLGQLKIPQRRKQRARERERDLHHHPPVQGKDSNKLNGTPLDAAISATGHPSKTPSQGLFFSSFFINCSDTTTH